MSGVLEERRERTPNIAEFISAKNRLRTRTWPWHGGMQLALLHEQLKDYEVLKVRLEELEVLSSFVTRHYILLRFGPLCAISWQP